MTFELGYLCAFLVLIWLAIIDFNILRFLDLMIQKGWVETIRFFFRLRLELDLLVIRFSRRKYERMAQEILSELSQRNEADTNRTPTDP